MYRLILRVEQKKHAQKSRINNFPFFLFSRENESERTGDKTPPGTISMKALFCLWSCKTKTMALKEGDSERGDEYIYVQRKSERLELYVPFSF